MKAAVVLLIAMTALTSLPAERVAFGQGPIVGVLEDVPDEYGGNSSPGVRVVFKKDGNDWKAFPTCGDVDCLTTVSQQYPQQVTWTIAFDGRGLGQVTGRIPTGFSFYSRVGLQDVGNGALPRVGSRSAAYGGESGASVYRPLVANSQPYVSDPESWQPSQLTPQQTRTVRQAFRSRFPKLCAISKADESKLQSFPYLDEDLKLVKAYEGKGGWMIARLHLAGAVDCEDAETGFEMNDTWFTIDPQKSVKYLDEGLWLVDAGDYDNDGQSEILFAINSHNRGGYKLFYDHFKKHTTFEYAFH
ncbi:hypothetical protein [Occallatibacter riparius]|uniref:Uncharacterized protein n=1 Tax=Occallatibacter riparius TaxID=1002689 RepID=A0A9J7BRS9_9BACT|nr:hypothetical protein [Occallatibacter riparius]UWZ85368.1 hypothetical protein MOP44_05365 [Occallatibacter riparius]